MGLPQGVILWVECMYGLALVGDFVGGRNSGLALVGDFCAPVMALWVNRLTKVDGSVGGCMCGLALVGGIVGGLTTANGLAGGCIHGWILKHNVEVMKASPVDVSGCQWMPVQADLREQCDNDDEDLPKGLI